MSFINVLERALPLVEKAASLHPAANEAFQIAKKIAGPRNEWEKNKSRARENLTAYFNQHNARISDTLDSLQQYRGILERVAPGFADEAEHEVSRLSREQSRMNDSGRNRSETHETGRDYRIYPVNRS